MAIAAAVRIRHCATWFIGFLVSWFQAFGHACLHSQTTAVPITITAIQRGSFFRRFQLLYGIHTVARTVSRNRGLCVRNVVHLYPPHDIGTILIESNEAENTKEVVNAFFFRVNTQLWLFRLGCRQDMEKCSDQERKQRRHRETVTNCPQRRINFLTTIQSKETRHCVSNVTQRVQFSVGRMSGLDPMEPLASPINTIDNGSCQSPNEGHS